MKPQVPLNQLSASEAAALIRMREISAVELVEACLARVAERESIVGAWEYLNLDRAVAQARERDAAVRRGPLHGIPFGIKDIIDTNDMPTSYGTKIYRGFRPDRNATCVQRLLASGAIILGKTVTTELANRAPGKTANPRNPRHTPGGSSSGSAAAVADFMVPAALGTQTTGSIIRPAAYCGIFGYKPTYGDFDVSGVRELSPSLDTLGVMCRSAVDLELIGSVLAGRPQQSLKICEESPPRLAVCRTPAWPEVEAASENALENAIALFMHANVPLETDLDCGHELNGLLEAQRTIMSVETARSLAKEYRESGESLSESLRTLIEYGMGRAPEAYVDALTMAQNARSRADHIFGANDALITPSTCGEAPLGLGNTGEPVFNAIWTLLHAPCVTVPMITGPHGLPVGVQIVGRPGNDTTVLAIATWLSRLNVADSYTSLDGLATHVQPGPDRAIT